MHELIELPRSVPVQLFTRPFQHHNVIWGSNIMCKYFSPCIVGVLIKSVVWWSTCKGSQTVTIDKTFTNSDNEISNTDNRPWAESFWKQTTSILSYF